jgi:hypothetical protein
MRKLKVKWIKKCKGVDSPICTFCKRFDFNEPEALVKKIGEADGRDTCNLHILR